nr:hypothetical protein [Tanacetum cinerariifolium]
MDPKGGFLEPKKKNLADKPSGHSPIPEPHAEVWPLSTKPYFCVTLEVPHLARNSPRLGRLPRRPFWVGDH